MKKSKITNILDNNQGFALLYAVMVMLILLSVGLTLLHTSTTEVSIAENQLRRTQAMYAAEAGLEKAMVEIKANYAYYPTAYSNNENFQRVQPGNVQTRYIVSVAHKGGSIYEITSVGYAGNAKYTQKAQLEIVISSSGSGGYLDYACSIYGNKKPSVPLWSIINGDIQVPGGEVDGLGIVNGTIVDRNPGFPNLPDNWYLPAGVPSTPYFIDGHINNTQSFNNLMDAIDEGHRYIKVKGQFSYCPAFWGILQKIDFQGAVIEFTGKIDIGGNRYFKNATFVSESKIEFGDWMAYENVTLVSKGKNNTIKFGVGTLGKGLVAYSEGDIDFDLFADLVSLISLQDTLLIARGTVDVVGIAAIRGSIIAEQVDISPFSVITFEPKLKETLGSMVPEGIDSVSVKVTSWGEPPSE
ncbi:MAG: pilus assembly PilX N-terminal domain-containing protein [Peptococcia bacterium]